MGDFEITAREESAAQLVAAGDLSNEDIANQVGVGRTTVYRWLNEPKFIARVEEIRDEYCKVVRRRGLSSLERRVEALNDRWLRMRQVIEARANDPKMTSVPGGSTGLLVHDVKGVGKGDDFHLVDLYSVDTALLKELREHEKQAAQELGQWTERKYVESRDLSAASEFDRRMGELAARAAEGGVPGFPDSGGQGPAQLSVDVLGATEPA